MGRAVRLETMQGDAVRSLGLAGNPDTESRFVKVAYRAGVNAYFFYSLSSSGLVLGLGRLLKGRRERVVVVTGTESRDPREMRAYFDRVRRRLDVDVIDVFFAEYVSPSNDMDEVLGKGGAIDEIWKWKAEGKVRYVGATAHSRPLSVELIKSGRVEVLMNRYNMAHRGAEGQVLPAAEAVGIPVVSFTCTRWGSLLKGHRGWTGPVPTAADCYRYVLRHPAVHLALTAPARMADLEENLSVLADASRPDAQQVETWERYGKLVYGKGDDAFEMRWP